MPDKTVRTRKTPRPPSPVHSDIAARAHELFLLRGGQHGQDWDDWLSAEQELAGLDAAMVRRTPTPPRQKRAARTPD